MEIIMFKVQGTSAEPYTTTFSRVENKVTARCTCMAGTKGLLCKHRIWILHGDLEKIVSGNHGDVQRVQSWIKGTDIEDLVNKIHDAESIIAVAKKNLETYKTTLFRSLK